MGNKYCVKCTNIFGKQKDWLSKNHTRQLITTKTNPKNQKQNQKIASSVNMTKLDFYFLLRNCAYT